MQDRYSFDSANDLIMLLKNAHAVLQKQSDRLLKLFVQLGESFKDDGYTELLGSMQQAYRTSTETTQQLGVVIAAIVKYKEELCRLYVEDLITQIGFETVSYETQPMFGVHGENLERKNQDLQFQNEAKMKMRQKDLSDVAKRVYASIGSRCEIGSNNFKLTEHYNPDNCKVYFNLQADFHNAQGQLSTYFHEIGHAIDHQRKKKCWLSDDAIFRDAIRCDFEGYISQVQQRFACDRQDAYFQVKQMLNENCDLLADISDIMGGLTDCQCQGIWGHDEEYWAKDANRVYQEAFANMYSTALGSPQRIEMMKKFFPNAYKRFEDLLEETA